MDFEEESEGRSEKDSYNNHHQARSRCVSVNSQRQEAEPDEGWKIKNKKNACAKIKTGQR